MRVAQSGGLPPAAGAGVGGRARTRMVELASSLGLAEGGRQEVGGVARQQEPLVVEVGQGQGKDDDGGAHRPYI